MQKNYQQVLESTQPPTWIKPASKETSLKRYFSDRNGMKKKITVVVIGILVFLAAILTVGYIIAEKYLKK